VKRRISVGVVVALAVVCLLPVLAYASVTGWSEYTVTSSAVGGKATTYDSRPYLAAIMNANVDGVIAAQNYQQLQPVATSYLIASKTTSRSAFGSGSHLLEVYGYHEAAELANGADKEVSSSYDDTTFTNGSRIAADEEALRASLSTAVVTKLESAHKLVEKAYGISCDGFQYLTYRDHLAIAENADDLFADRDTALAFLEATMLIHHDYLEVGDMGPGYWIGQDGNEAIVGTQKADGTSVAFLVKLNADTSTWDVVELGELVQSTSSFPGGLQRGDCENEKESLRSSEPALPAVPGQL